MSNFSLFKLDVDSVISETELRNSAEKRIANSKAAAAESDENVNNGARKRVCDGGGEGAAMEGDNNDSQGEEEHTVSGFRFLIRAIQNRPRTGCRRSSKLAQFTASFVQCSVQQSGRVVNQ